MLALSVLSLAALAVASPIRSAQDYATALRHVARRKFIRSRPYKDKAHSTTESVSDSDVDNFAFFAEHAGAAYCHAGVDAGTPIVCNGNCPTVEANGATILGTFDGLWTGIAGYVAVDEVRSEIVFSVRGSSNVRNWISNLNFDLEESSLTDGAEVHDGFNQAWNEMSSGVSSAISDALGTYPGFKIIATGHSLGGAVATLGAAALRNEGHSVDIYSYGAPRVGNDVVSDYITAQDGPEFRITHLDDPVSRLPPIIFGYRHTSPEYWLSVSESSGPDYPLDEIVVCPGNDNIECNAGTFGLNIGAHLAYFGEISGCNGKFGLKEDTSTMDDAELEGRLDGWVEEDIAFVSGG